MGSRGEGNAVLKLVVLVATTALVLFPAPAVGKKKHKKAKALGPVVTATATGPTVSSPGDLSIADANCPPRLQAVGGGFSAPFNGTDKLVVTQSYRSSPGTWRVAAMDGTGTGAATAHAYCRRNNRVITDVPATATIPSGFGQNAKAQGLCAPGVAAVSGGFQITTGPGPATAIPMESIGGGPTPGGIPADGNWSVVAQNIGASQTITAHVYCMRGIRVPAFRQDQVSSFVSEFASLTATSSCPVTKKPKKGKKKRKKKPAQLLSAGAFYSPFVPGSSMVFPIHTDSRISSGGFIDTAVNNNSGGTLTVQSQAMCF